MPPMKNLSDDEEVILLDENQMKEDPLFQATIERSVEGKVFQAKVEEISCGTLSGERLYRVRYTDGDKEDLSETDLLRNSKLIKVQGDPEVDQGGNLAVDFRQLWASGHMSDVCLHVQGEDVRAHKLILGTRSPVFQRMFATSMSESASGVVQIEDMRSVAIRHLCEFIYTGTIEDEKLWEESNAIQELLHAALKYEVVSLICICVSKAEAQITVTNAVEWLNVASRIQAHAQRLKFLCIQFILQNLAEVQCTLGWSDLMQNRTLLSEAAPILFRGLCPPAKRKLDQQPKQRCQKRKRKAPS